MRRGGGPGSIGRAEQRVDRLTGNVAVDESLRETFRDVGRTLDVEGVPGQCQGQWTISVEKHPSATPPEFVAGSVE